MNSIGAFAFNSLEGQPLAIGEDVVVLERPGVDGVAVWKAGARGKRFRLRSSVDGFSLAHARSLYKQYGTLVGADPQDLQWNGIWITDANQRVAILAVTPVTICTLLGAVGGQSPPSLGYVECDWDLILVSVN